MLEAAEVSSYLHCVLVGRSNREDLKVCCQIAMHSRCFFLARPSWRTNKKHISCYEGDLFGIDSYLSVESKGLQCTQTKIDYI